MAIGSEGREPTPRPELARLPRGRHGLPRDFVARNQRERLIAGLAAAVFEKGYAKTTVADITRHAAVSRRTFYEHFSSKEECFVTAYDVVLELLQERLVAAYEAEREWPLAMRAALVEFLRFLAAEPEFARLGLVEGLRAGTIVYARYTEALDSFVRLLRLGRRERPDGDLTLPATTEEAVVGGIASLLTRRILTGEGERLEELQADVVRFALTPYLGPVEAERLANETGD